MTREAELPGIIRVGYPNSTTTCHSVALMLSSDPEACPGRKTYVAMFRQLTLAYFAVALTAGITGCGSSGGSGGTGPLASDSAATILTEATANTIAAQSFTMSGGTTGQSVDLTIVRGLGCSGTIVQGTTKWKLIWIGKTIYAHQSGMPANEWMRGASSASNLQGLIALCQPSSLLGSLATSGVSSATRSVTVYGGQPALSLTLPVTQNNVQPGSIVVTDTQTPVLLDISEPGTGHFTFTGYGATKTIAPPAAS